jgi:hypothetical protein
MILKVVAKGPFRSILLPYIQSIIMDDKKIKNNLKNFRILGADS